MKERYVQLSKTNYTASSSEEFLISIPNLISGYIIKVMIMCSELRHDQYSWDRNKGILILKLEKGLLKGETIEILYILKLELESDPIDPRPDPIK